MYFLLLTVFCISVTLAQDPMPAIQPQTAPDEVSELKKKIHELEEVSKEHSELLKLQLKDQHYDQSSRGYIELKFGRSKLNPKDIEDENDDVFNDLDDANWEKFDYSNLIDLEIGKVILGAGDTRHEIGIGYQHLRSKKLQATYTPTSGNRIKATETIMAHTLFARYSMLFRTPGKNNFYFGPGVTLGYSPVSKLLIEIEQGNEGAQIYGESQSMLLEIFGKAKVEISRSIYLVIVSGYRLQEAENLKLTAAEIVSVKTNTDLDMSGLYGTAGFAASF